MWGHRRGVYVGNSQALQEYCGGHWGGQPHCFTRVTAHTGSRWTMPSKNAVVCALSLDLDYAELTRASLRRARRASGSPGERPGESAARQATETTLGARAGGSAYAHHEQQQELWRLLAQACLAHLHPSLSALSGPSHRRPKPQSVYRARCVTGGPATGAC